MAATMARTFYPRKSILVTGDVCSIFFAVAVVGYSALLFVNDAPAYSFKSTRDAVALGYLGIALFGTMFLVSLLSIAEYWVLRCTCDDSYLTLYRLFRRIEVPLTSIDHIEWSKLSQPMAVVKYLGCSAKIKLSEYRDADQLALIRMLRRVVRDDQQSGWPMFCYKVALPLRDGPQWRTPRPDESLITRKRYDRLIAVLLPLIGIISLICWLTTKRVEALVATFVIPIVLISFWLLLRSSVPKGGRHSEDLLRISGGPPLLVTLAGCFVSLFWIKLMQVFDIPTRFIWPTFLAWISIPLLSLLYAIPRLERKRGLENEERLSLALRLWEEGEAVETPLHGAPE